MGLPFSSFLVLYMICTDERQQSQMNIILFDTLVRLPLSPAVSSYRSHQNPRKFLEGYLTSLLSPNHLTDAFGYSNYLKTAVPVS
ncbi:hypothetical protein Hanom_Chr00s000004g01610391 [Helianthus anomalus]